MTVQNSLHRSFGRLSLPLAASSIDSLNLDPANAILLALFKAALNAELAPIWTSAVSGTPIDNSTPVQQALPTMPDLDTMRQVMTAYPLLCVSRSRRNNAMVIDEYELDRPRLTQLWDVDYILGPLEIGNELRLDDSLQAVVKILTLVVLEGGHMAYRTGTNQGFAYALNVMTSIGDAADTVLADGIPAGSCGFDSIELTEAATGPAAFSQNGPKFHSASMTLKTTELAGEGVAGDMVGVPFAGSTGEFGLTQSGDPSIIARTPTAS